MKIFLLLIASFLISFPTFPQSDFCETDTSRTVPVSAEEIQNYYRMNGNKRMTAGNDIVPLRVHVVQQAAGLGISEALIMQQIQSLNASFSTIQLEFQLCSSVEYITNPTLYNLDSYEEQWDLIIPYNDPRTVDLFIVGSINHRSACGYATLGWDGDGFIVIQNSCFTEATVLHEFGHYFNLPHTHEDLYGKELVNGSNCSTAGDQVCDTPADPNLLSNVSFDCQYNGTFTDANGQFYQPDVGNYMSYAPGNCRNHFTPLQFQRMRYFYDAITKKYLTCSTHSDFMVEILMNSAKLNKGQANAFHLKIINYSWLSYTGPLSYRITVKDLYGNETILASSQISQTFTRMVPDTIPVSVSVPSQFSDGLYMLSVIIDPANEITETFENNNTDDHEVGIYDPTLQLPDLKVGYTAEKTHFAGTNFRIMTSTTNYGNVSSNSFDCITYISEDSIPDKGDIIFNFGYVGDLAPGQTYLSIHNVPLPKNLGKTHYVIFAADFQDKVKEISEKNNMVIIPVNNVSPPETLVKPDYIITSHKFTYQNYTSLTSLERPRLEFTVDNTGQAIASNSITGVYISTDNVLSPNDIFLGRTTNSYIQFVVPLAIPSGNYYFILKADDPDYVYETNENNNTYSFPMLIIHQDYPEMAVTGYDVSSYFWNYNSSFTIDVDFMNEGTASCSNYYVNLFLEKEKYSYSFPQYEFLLQTYLNTGWISQTIPPNGSHTFSYTGVLNETYEEGYYYLAACAFAVSPNFNGWDDNNCVVFERPILLTKDVVTSVRDKEANVIQIYPNPADKSITIEAPFSIDQVIVSSLTGNVLFTDNSIASVDVSSWQPGIYVVTIQSGEERYHKKLVIRK